MSAQKAIHWIESNQESIFQSLSELVAIQSISTDGDHDREIQGCAEAVRNQMNRAGFPKTEILELAGAYPYVFGEIPAPPGAPTLLMLSHYDVQPLNYLDQWLSEPWKLTRREGRLFGRGAADDI